MDTTTGDSERLEHAASHLLSVGRADPLTVGPSLRLLCLAAADRLIDAGVHPARLEIAPPDAETAIRNALTELAALTPARFAETEVLDAAAYAHDALQMLA